MITNLEVVEVDKRETLTKIHLRWQNPLPPLNGKLAFYMIAVCDIFNTNCTYIYVELNAYCHLWDNYICKIIETTKPCPKIYVRK